MCFLVPFSRFMLTSLTVFHKLFDNSIPAIKKYKFFKICRADMRSLDIFFPQLEGEMSEWAPIKIIPISICAHFNATD